MPLTNQQYDSILREYEERQNHSRRTQLQKLNEIYEKHSGIRGNRSCCFSVSAAHARKLLDGDTHALADLKKHTLHTLSEKKSVPCCCLQVIPQIIWNPVYNCTRCKDTLLCGRQKCLPENRKIVALLYEQSNIKETLKRENPFHIIRCILSG